MNAHCSSRGNVGVRAQGARAATFRSPRTSSRRPLRPEALLKPAEGTKVEWSQSVDDVNVRVHVDPSVRGKEVHFEVHPKRLLLKVRGETVLAGGLADAGEISVDGCFWNMESEGDSKVVAITLAKRSMGYKDWEALLESERLDLSITNRAFLTLSADKELLGTVVLGLFGKAAPRTVENFRALCTGEKGTGGAGKPLHYKGSAFHRIIPTFMAQGGDITEGNGFGGESIYGPTFEDEILKIGHDEAGYLAMANAGPNTNSSQFYIIYEPQPHLNGKHVVFGKVLAGMDVLREVESLGTESGKPKGQVVIEDCGEATEEDVARAEEENTELRMAKEEVLLGAAAEARTAENPAGPFAALQSEQAQVQEQERAAGQGAEAAKP